MTFSCRWRC